MSRRIFTAGEGRGGRAIATQFPLFGDGYPVHFWAEKGLVRFEDERPDVEPHKKFGVLDWRVAAENVLALSDLIIRSSEDPSWAHERQKLQQFICDMEEVIKEAKNQGGPLDGPDVIKERVRRRPKSVIVPQVVEID